MADVKDYFSEGLTTDDLEVREFDDSPVPEGKHVGNIANASPEPNGENWKDPNGEHLKLEIHITSETSKGRHIWKNITLMDVNSEYVEWGKQDLMRLMNAAGIGSLSSFDQLIGKSVGFTVTHKKDNGSTYTNVTRWAVAAETKSENSDTTSTAKKESKDEGNAWDI